MRLRSSPSTSRIVGIPPSIPPELIIAGALALDEWKRTQEDGDPAFGLSITKKRYLMRDVLLTQNSWARNGITDAMLLAAVEEQGESLLLAQKVQRDTETMLQIKDSLILTQELSDAIGSMTVETKSLLWDTYPIMRFVTPQGDKTITLREALALIAQGTEACVTYFEHHTGRTTVDQTVASA